MACRCGSIRIASVNANCMDQCSIILGARNQDGYVPLDMGISVDGYAVQFDWCLDCGLIQRVTEWPLCLCLLELPEEPEPPPDPPPDP